MYHVHVSALLELAFLGATVVRGGTWTSASVVPCEVKFEAVLLVLLVEPEVELIALAAMVNEEWVLVLQQQLVQILEEREGLVVSYVCGGYAVSQTSFAFT